MNIDAKDVVTLSDNIKYVVVSKINHDNNTYYILTQIDNITNIKFLVENKERNSLLEVEDKTLIQKLLAIFYEQAKENFNSDI